MPSKKSVKDAITNKTQMLLDHHKNLVNKMPVQKKVLISILPIVNIFGIFLSIIIHERKLYIFFATFSSTPSTVLISS